MVAPNGAAWRAVAFLLFLLVAIGFSVPPVAAYHVGTTKIVSLQITETITLPMNHYAVYTLTLASGDTLTYSVTVTAGTEIDMYIVPADGLVEYVDESAPTFSVYRLLENELTYSGAFPVTSQTSGTDSLIVDNVDFRGAIPSGDATVAVNLTRTPATGLSLALIGGIVLVVIIVVALVAVLALRARRKRAAMPPPMMPPAYPGPPGPYAPPPYTPPPQQPPQGPYPPPPSR